MNIPEYFYSWFYTVFFSPPPPVYWKYFHYLYDYLSHSLESINFWPQLHLMAVESNPLMDEEYENFPL